MINFKCQINQTKIHIVEDDITRIIADVIVSSDGIYLSRSGGVSRAISIAAGDALADDIRKLSIPLALGSVAVTSAGRLPAKYIFHATTIDFSKRPSMDALIAHLIRRILEIGVALKINHIALPLLGTGYAGHSPKQGLDCIFNSVAYCLASTNFPGIEQISILIFGLPDIQSIIEEIEKKIEQAEVKQQRMKKLRAICTELPKDEELNEMLNARIHNTTDELRKLFYFKEMDDSIDLEKNIGVEGHEEARRQLQQAIEKLDNQITSEQKLLEIKTRRLQILKEGQALQGSSAPPAIQMEIEDTEKQNQIHQHNLEQMRTERSVYQKEFNAHKY